MAEEQIEQGDIVWLRSGGPAMTINGRSSGGSSLNCSWFDKGELKNGFFLTSALTKTKPDKDLSA